VPQRALDRQLRLLGLGVLLSLTAHVGAADELRPFESSYAWIWHGMNVAVSTLKLEKTGDTWTYTSKSEPRGIGKVFAERPTQKSILRVTDNGTFPVSYQANDGTSSTKRTVDVQYDWDAKRLTGVYEEVKVDLPLKPGVQDDGSVQVALMVELLRGHTPEHFLLLNRDEVREYRYVREGEDKLSTPLGEIDTVIYRSQKQNSPRVTRFWCAPARGYIPMKVEQKRGDDIEWSMEIKSLKRE